MSKIKEEIKYDIEQHFYLLSKLDENNYRQRIGVLAIGVSLYKRNTQYDGYIAITGSVCSLLDNFNSKAGRRIALQRLKSRSAKTRKVTFLTIYNDNYCLSEIISFLKLKDALEKRNIDYAFCSKRLENIMEFIMKEISKVKEAEDILEGKEIV